MKFLNFYRRKADFILRTKFITFKFFYVNYYLKNFSLEFKSTPGLSSGGFILLYTTLLRFSTMQPKFFFKRVQSLVTHNKIAPEIKTHFSLSELRGSKRKAKVFLYLFFLLHSRITGTTQKIRECLNTAEVSFAASMYVKSFQQTFLGFSSHMLGGIRFAEAYYSFFWRLSSQFLGLPGFRVQKELLSPRYGAVMHRRNERFLQQSFKGGAAINPRRYGFSDIYTPEKPVFIHTKFYLQLAKSKLFNKHKILSNFIFSNAFNRATIF